MAKTLLFGRGRKLQFFITLVCQLSFCLMGYDQGVFSSVVTDEDFLDRVGNPDDAELGIIVANYNLGCLAGSILAFFTCEKLGRRWCIWVAMGWITAGAMLQASAFSRAHLVIGRVICGVGTGIDTSTVPMYQSELCPAKKRGRLVASEIFFVFFGIVLSYWYNYGMSFVSNSSSWRLPVASQIIFAMACTIIVFGIPESPRYLCKVGKPQEALRVLSVVYDKPTDHEDIVSEHNDILRALQVETSDGEYKWRTILNGDRVQTGRRVVLAYIVSFINQMSGINLVVYFIPTVLHTNVGMSKNMAHVIGGLVNVSTLCGAALSIPFADKYGRRRPLMLGCTATGFSMMMVAICLSFKENEAVGAQMSKAAVTFFFTFGLAFGMTTGSLTFVYGPEVLPLHARAKGSAVSMSGIWLWNFFVVMITPVIINRIQWKSYLIFALLNYLFVPTLYFFFPELANLTLEEVDEVFTAGINPVKAAANLQREKRGMNGGDNAGSGGSSVGDKLSPDEMVETARK